MQKSLFRKYFSVCASLIVLALTFLGVVFLMFASQYFKDDKFELLEKNARYALNATEDYCINMDGSYQISASLIDVYIPLAKAMDADIYLANLNGTTLMCTHRSYCNHKANVIPNSVRGKILEEGVYRGVGEMGKIYSTPYYTVGLPFTVGNGQVAGMVFISSSAQDLTGFLGEMLKLFLLSALCVIIISFVIIYFVTSNMVKPLRDMLSATESFAKGDFTVRVPVNEMDEVGMLSMAFNNMATSLAQQESVRRSFIANVSHELKTPMTTIAGFIDGIMDGTIPPEKERHYLNIVSNEVKRLSRLVRSMLNIARLESGEMKLDPTSFDVNEVVCSTIFNFERAIEEKELEIKGLDVGKIMVEADRDLIHQVVYNLIENAVKFVNHGGYIEVNYRTENKMTYISIKNSGEGISKDEISKVFDRFYKTDRSRSLDKTGVGLGLYIVRSIINLHQGEMIVRSAEGEYCEFCFSVPAGKSQPKGLRHPVTEGTLAPTLPPQGTVPEGGRETDQRREQETDQRPPQL